MGHLWRSGTLILFMIIHSEARAKPYMYERKHDENDMKSYCIPNPCEGVRLGDLIDHSPILYPFGVAVGDDVMVRVLDGYSPPINTTHSFPFGFDHHNVMWVTNKGLVSFNRGFYDYRPIPFPISDYYNYYGYYYYGYSDMAMIAAFWTDINLCANDGNIYYRQSTDQELLTRATMDIRNAYKPTNQHQSFEAVWLLIATWHHVTYYGGNNCSSVNTFQQVLVTDETVSFAIFNYPNITWSTLEYDEFFPHAQVGFHVDEYFYYSLPTAMTPLVVDLDVSSNVGETGRFVLRVDGNVEIPEYTCPERPCPPNHEHNKTDGECYGSEYPAMNSCGPRLTGPKVEDELYVFFFCEVNLTTSDPLARIKVTFLFDETPDEGVPDQILEVPENMAPLHEKYLSGRLPVTISCTAATFWQNDSSSTSIEVTSNTNFVGLWPSDTSLRLTEADDTPTGLLLYSSIPITCTYRDSNEQLKGCSLDFKIQSTSGIAVFTRDNEGEVTRCSFSLHPEDWDSDKNLATNDDNPLEFLATRDPYDLIDSDHGSVTLSIHPDSLEDINLANKVDSDGNFYPNPWHSITIPSIQVVRIDNNGAQCISSGDPRMTTFDRSYYNAGQTGTFILARSNSSRTYEVQVVQWACPEGSSGCSIACAVAVREGRYAYGLDVCNSDGVVHRLVLSNDILDYDPITTDESRYNWKITMPSGASVNMYVTSPGRGRMNVYVNVLPRDAGKTDGLCGTFDSDRSNDFLLSNGSIIRPENGGNYQGINAFIESWRIRHEDSLFAKPPTSNGPPDFSEAVEYLCTCAFDQSVDIPCGFEALEDPILRRGHPSIPIDALQPPWMAQEGNGFSRMPTRSLGVDIDDSYVLVDLIPDSSNTLPEDLTWPTFNNITEDMASSHCDTTLRNSAPYWACGGVIVTEEFDAVKLKCLNDIKTTGDLTWALDKVTELQSKCLHQMFDTNSTSNSTDEILAQVEMIISSLCPEDCHGNGACVDGLCQCNTGYIGGDCSLPAGTNPTINKLLGPIHCDIRQRPCEYVRIMATDIVSSDLLTCKVRGTRFSENDTVKEFDWTVTGLKTSPTEVQCSLPLLDPDENLLPAYLYNVSVSNDGTTFSDNGCLIKGQCHKACEVNPMDATEECNPSILARGWSLLNEAPCEWSRWTQDECTKSCDYGLEHKHRRCLVEHCEGQTTETDICNTFNCEEIAKEMEQGVMLIIHDATPSEIARKEEDILNLTATILTDYCDPRTEECCAGFQQSHESGSGISFLILKNVVTAKGFPRDNNQGTRLRLLAKIASSELDNACGTSRTIRQRQSTERTSYFDSVIMASIIKSHLDEYEMILGHDVSVEEDKPNPSILYIALGVGGGVLLIVVVGTAVGVTKKKKAFPKSVHPEPDTVYTKDHGECYVDKHI